MHPDEFIRNFADAVEDIEPGSLSLDTNFRELENWSSIAALMTLAMIYSEYSVQITGNELETCKTLGDLFTTINSKVLEKA